MSSSQSSGKILTWTGSSRNIHILEHSPSRMLWKTRCRNTWQGPGTSARHGRAGNPSHLSLQHHHHQETGQGESFLVDLIIPLQVSEFQMFIIALCGKSKLHWIEFCWGMHRDLIGKKIKIFLNDRWERVRGLFVPRWHISSTGFILLCLPCFVTAEFVLTKIISFD